MVFFKKVLFALFSSLTHMKCIKFPPFLHHCNCTLRPYPAEQMALKTINPIFHQKSHLRWVANAREQETNNMNSTCPTQIEPLHTQRELYSTGSCWVSPGFALGPPGFFDTNMLASACVWGLEQCVGDLEPHVGCLDQREDPTRSGFALWWNISFKPIFH